LLYVCWSRQSMFDRTAPDPPCFVTTARFGLLFLPTHSEIMQFITVFEQTGLPSLLYCSALQLIEPVTSENTCLEHQPSPEPILGSKRQASVSGLSSPARRIRTRRLPRVKGARELLPQQTDCLHQWLWLNRTRPYPTKADVSLFSIFCVVFVLRS
jgi:hypothetical protein